MEYLYIFITSNRNHHHFRHSHNSYHSFKMREIVYGALKINVASLSFCRTIPSNGVCALITFWRVVRKKFFRKSHSHAHRLSRLAISTSDTSPLSLESCNLLATCHRHDYTESIANIKMTLSNELHKLHDNFVHIDRSQWKNICVENAFFAIQLLLFNSSNFYFSK